MTSCRSGHIRRFRLNLPQRVAAALLALFLLQGLWLIGRQAQVNIAILSSLQDSGGQSWTPADNLASCLIEPDGILACYMARIPVALVQLARPGFSFYATPQNRTGRLRLLASQFLIRLPFLAAGALLGGALWWVTRRLYGNRGGYTALALYCFSPAVLQASTIPNTEILAALGVYGGIYTSIGVAHAMQGPKRKWRARIVLMTMIFAWAAASHLSALAFTVALGVALMLWVTEQNRRLVIPVVLIATVGALVILFVGYGFSATAVASLFRYSDQGISLSLRPATQLFGGTNNAGTAAAAVIAFILYLAARRFRYFGNTAPLLCAVLLLALALPDHSVQPWLWALPFLLTFVGGVFADAYETSKGRLATAIACLLILLQAAASVSSIQGLL
jgi:hypothetical protein